MPLNGRDRHQAQKKKPVRTDVNQNWRTEKKLVNYSVILATFKDSLKNHETGQHLVNRYDRNEAFWVFC